MKHWYSTMFRCSIVMKDCCLSVTLKRHFLMRAPCLVQQMCHLGSYCFDNYCQATAFPILVITAFSTCLQNSPSVFAVFWAGSQELGAVCELVASCSDGNKWGSEWRTVALESQDWPSNRLLQRSVQCLIGCLIHSLPLCTTDWFINCLGHQICQATAMFYSSGLYDADLIIDMISAFNGHANALS